MLCGTAYGLRPRRTSSRAEAAWGLAQAAKPRSYNVTLLGGVAPARAYIPELLGNAPDGRLAPSPVFDMTVGPDGVPGRPRRDGRGGAAIKVLIEP